MWQLSSGPVGGRGAFFCKARSAGYFTVLFHNKKGRRPNDLKSLMRQPRLHKEKHCATRVLLVTHFHRRPQRIDTCDGETAVTGGLIDRFQLVDQ